MKMKYRQLVSLLWVLCLFVLFTFPVGAEDRPVVVKFDNNSDHVVHVHILTNGAVVTTHTVGPKNAMELDVVQGDRIRLEYAPPPHQTTLSEMGSRNELYRTVSLRNDGVHLFIQEKFSGQREKGIGKARMRFPTASDPQKPGEPPKTGQAQQGNLENMDHLKSTRKEDILGAEPKEPKGKAKAANDKKAKKDKKDG